MNIKGIGKISKKEISTVLTKECLKSLKNGNMIWEEAGEIYKYEMIRNESIIGSNVDTFSKNYSRIPPKLRVELSPKDLASLVDAFYKCYGDGKREGKE